MKYLNPFMNIASKLHQRTVIIFAFFLLVFKGPVLAATGLIVTAPVDPCVLELISSNDPGPRPFGARILAEKLREMKASDLLVAKVIKGIDQLLRSSVPTAPGSSEPDSLAAALRDSESFEALFIGSYMNSIAHRTERAPRKTDEEQAALRAIDPALVHISLDSIFDMMMVQVIQNNLRIPKNNQAALLNLINGGLVRIQARADTWMLNKHLDKFAETEQLLRRGVTIPPESLFEAFMTLNSADGGTPQGFQSEAKQRPSTGAGTNAADVPAASVALTQAESSGLVRSIQMKAIDAVRRQSPHTAVALESIETHLQNLSRGDPNLGSKLDAYGSYLQTVLVASHKIWAQRGVLDKLAEVCIIHGDDALRQEYMVFIYDGLDKIRTRARRNRDLYFESTLALFNVILARESWGYATARIVMNRLNALVAASGHGAAANGIGQGFLDEILGLRRSETPDANSALVAMRSSAGTATDVRWGAYDMTFSVVNATADGRPVKALEVRNLKSRLVDDTEFSQTVAQLELLAKQEGFNSIQFADWTNIHEARAFRATGQFIEVTREIQRANYRDMVPTFIKNLGFAADSSDLIRFLASAHSRGTVDFGPFNISFRNTDFTTMVPGPPERRKTLTLTNINSSAPGSGNYGDALHRIESLAIEHGFKILIIEGVSDARQWAFYEGKMGYLRAPRDNDFHRIYYKIF